MTNIKRTQPLYQKSTQLILIKLAILLISTTVLSSCGTTPSSVSKTAETATSVQPSTDAGSAETDTTHQIAPPKPDLQESSLDAALLNHLLIGNIASRRGQYDIAAESLSQASALSKDRRVIADAIQLSGIAKDFPSVIKLSTQLEQMDPGNYRVLLTLSSAHFELAEYEQGLSVLQTLIAQQSTENEGILRSIAGLLSRQKNQAAVDGFYQHLENKPSDPLLNFVGTLVASDLGHNDRLERYLQRALAAQPDWEATAIINVIQLTSTSIDNAIRFGTRFLKNNPGANRFRLQFARLLIRNERLGIATKHLQGVLEQEPDSSEALYTMGLIYMDKGQDNKAQASFEKLLTLIPQHNQSKTYLAEIAKNKKDYDLAISYLQQITGEQYLEAQIALARVLILQKGVDAGIGYLQRIGVRTETDKVRLILEQESILREHDQLDRLKLFLDENLRQYPNQPDLLYSRGLLAAQLELLQLHERDMKQLIQIQPENAHAYNALGYTLADKTDRLDEAMDLITKANELLPDNAFILDSLGWVHYRMGNNKKAIGFLTRAIGLDPDAEIAAHLGEVLWITGEKKEARKIWQQGKSLGAKNPVLLETMERLLSN